MIYIALILLYFIAYAVEYRRIQSMILASIGSFTFVLGVILVIIFASVINDIFRKGVFI